MGKRDEEGNYLTISEVKQKAKIEKVQDEERKPPEPTTDPKPPAQTDPGPDPGGVIVDEFYVEEIAREYLPGIEQFIEYANQAKERVFRDLAEQVINRSGLNIDQFEQDVSAIADEVADKEEELNARTVPPLPQPSGPGKWEPLPGVSSDEVCTSIFDVDDLALRGRKSVTTRRYHQPLILTDAFIEEPRVPPDNIGWSFGQKLEHQQEWRHEGFTLGELVSSMSLLPGEELTVEVSSWQRTKTEISEEQDDTTRKQFENEQRNTDERTCTNETAYQNGWSVSASGSFSCPCASASVSASASGSTSVRAEQQNRALSEATTKATNEVSSRRALKLTQTSEAGSEATTTRRIRNPNECHTVTFNFFQVIKLYDLQLRLVGDSPMLLLPGIFPRFYGPLEERRGETANAPTEVQIPFHVIEGWRSPAVFLTHYFEVDRDLCREISGWALRVRFDTTSSPATAVRNLAEALVVATRYLLLLDPANYVAPLGQLLSDYVNGILQLRRNSSDRYGPDEGRTEQLNTSGIYVDSLRGRCTACEDHTTAGRYVEVMERFEGIRRLRKENELDEMERQRREKRLEEGNLDPFAPVEESIS